MIHIFALLASCLIGYIPEVHACIPTVQDEVATIILNDENVKDLGPVNLCDPDGNVCLNAHAYLDKDTKRIYVTIGNRVKYYSQRSNDERWPLMVRYNDKWYYFDF